MHEAPPSQAPATFADIANRDCFEIKGRGVFMKLNASTILPVRFEDGKPVGYGTTMDASVLGSIGFDAMDDTAIQETVAQNALPTPYQEISSIVKGLAQDLIKTGAFRLG